MGDLAVARDEHDAARDLFFVHVLLDHRVESFQPHRIETRRRNIGRDRRRHAQPKQTADPDSEKKTGTKKRIHWRIEHSPPRGVTCEINRFVSRESREPTAKCGSEIKSIPS